MNNYRIYRGQPKECDECLFVPSALRKGLSKKVEKFLSDLEFNVNFFKKECKSILKKGPFQDCIDEIPYIFWLSIVFCEIKFSHMGKNTSFSSTGLIPYPINRGIHIAATGEIKFDGAMSKDDYAMKMVQYYFERNPPDKSDDFLRKYMDHQHYYKGSCGHDPWTKGYRRNDGIIVDGNGLPDHFTLLLDWTQCKYIAEKEEFSGVNGTIVSIDLGKYINFVGDDYLMSYNDEIVRNMIDTAESQQSIVTFWPWTFTIGELEKNDLGKILDFRRE